MFKPIKGGSVIEVQGLQCHIPPVGKVFNVLSNQVEGRPVITRSQAKKEQYWERISLPEWWAKEEAEEVRMQEKDPTYQSAKLSEIINQEWDRRLNGVWFMNNGTATYITGLHYLYLQWWKIDVGYPKFRSTDQEYFYFLQYCIEDPECMGMIEVTKRRQGKTMRSGVFLYEYVSRSENANAGIQSKTNKDAKKVFSKAVIAPFKKLPKFFRPEYDKAQGITPKTELRFRQTNIKGRKAEELLDKEELDSGIDFMSSEEMAYDGQKLYRYVRDEAGKTVEANVYDSHDVVRYCLLDDEGKIIGKALYTTTVEEMEKGGSAFKLLWDDSDQGKIQENGRTSSGLYRFFMPAHRTRMFDKYGFPDEASTLKLILADRDSIKHNTRALSARKRKEPLTIEEAFRIDGDTCLYDSEILNNQLDLLSWKENLTERGNFIWEGAIRDSRVIWVKDKNGHWEICWNFKHKEESNQIEKRGNTFRPKNTHRFVGGADTFSHDKVLDYRRSDGALIIKMRFDPTDDSTYQNAFVCKYKYRAPSASMQYEDMLMTAVYFGCQILFESTRNNWKQYFIDRGYEAFLMKLPQFPDYGMPATPATHQILAEVTEEYIVTHCSKVFFKDCLTDWLEFDIGNTQKYDVAMAAGYCLIADKSKVYRRSHGNIASISDYGFKKYKTA